MSPTYAVPLDHSRGAGCIPQNETMKTPSLGVMVSIGGLAGILAVDLFWRVLPSPVAYRISLHHVSAVGGFPLPDLLAEGVVWDFF